MPLLRGPLVLVLVLVLVLLDAADAQLPFIGRCPRPPILKHFQVHPYLGTWYEHEKFFTFFDLGGKCVHSIYTDQGYGRIGVENQQIKVLTGKMNSIVGVARVVDPHQSARLRVVFSNTPNFGNGANYNVLETDYHNYAVVWSCKDYKLFNTQFLRILTRKRHPDAYMIKDVKNRLEYYGLKTSKLKTTNQRDCPYGY
ncbi:apolipoprotein D-like [Pollicipes pollicipes]|uniref:apolipoprotein D-like n=1 Tax=Pollicipes pollicipes TaxID=41117 RepID=UPI001884B51B|nr:apolipoprotein D-like [Pollicipes pollicipes]